MSKATIARHSAQHRQLPPPRAATTVRLAASPKPRVSLRQAHDDLAVAVSVKAVSLAAGGA